MPKTLVEKVEAFFYEDPKFQNSMESFARKHCDIIDLSTEENKLEYTPLHAKYQKKFESLITNFIESIGGTVQEFYRELKEDNERDPNGSNAIFSQILCAIADYDVFIQLMRETKEKEDEDQSSEEELNGK
mmetsp:Transcript_54389/g.80696  ORF Transcript_54389/g.80696 Transcript_54389/m.80696 type:complete len:131 (-) Transcript_54389:19-411(-)|eukprot:CAMPEP_0195517482 /NCGR_PEP_ID=MMETSP0794_2-20130614/10972_1 /TAXON_ID=515487 /ORGANISM="Stephanopyxis turris, Strain CCMP 815" /LENGTH=130 /DNA_ID=CAMNT_0040646297 /DNA_START=104 /DNA_END=496 /DNA_ORIENTATION=-